MSSMTSYSNTVVGSYPRAVQAADTMKKPTLSRAETDELVRWAARDQSALGLDVITDGKAYRENMYYFYQRRVDGITFENMPPLASETPDSASSARASSGRSRIRASIWLTTGASRATRRLCMCASSRP